MSPHPTAEQPAVVVAKAGSIPDGEALVVPRDRTGHDDDIAVFHDGDSYYALDDTCTHAKASLAEGWIEGGEVECPLHSARFSLSTGKALCFPAVTAARTHAVEVVGDEIVLHPGRPAADAG